MPQVPHWNTVTFPNGYTVVYKSLEKANIGRIWARAWVNWWQANQSTLPAYGRWAEFARGINFTNPHPKRGSVGSGISSRLFNCIKNGTLPKDQEVRDYLFHLAGYPWE